MNHSRRTAIFTALLLVLMAWLPSTLLADDSPGSLTWKASSEKYKADGSFKKWELTTVDIPDGDLTKGTVEIKVDLASVWEKADGLVDHLKNADFFEVEKYTTSTIKITNAKNVGGDDYEATATVTLHGNTADMPVKFSVVQKSPLKIEGTATLDRRVFGIGKDDDGITQEVAIELSATLE